jgi:replicative DNA helicase
MIKRDTIQIGEYLKETVQKIIETSKSKSPFSGISSGYEKLDKITSGWQPSDLIIVAARPSMGKTAFVLSMAANMAIRRNISVAIFSLEMSCSQIIERLICSEAEIPSESLRNGKLSDKQWERLDRCIHSLETAPIYIDDTPALSVFELRAKCRRLKRKNNINLVVVDYLQLMTAKGNPRSNREQEVSQISRSVKSLAKELEVPVIALSQLNRSVESRTGSKRPQLSDLRESGAIEQDADVVAFIHRPEKYGILQDENGNSLRGITEIILAKHRNGPLGDITLKFIDEYVKFIAADQELIPEKSMRYYQSKMNPLTN